FTGCSGLPSTFTIRPSRLRAMTPQPAGHSRQTVANQDATPGTSCSFGTTRGRIFSVTCWQPAAAAAAPVVVPILKKSRRFTLGPSMVTGNAVERCVHAAVGVLGAMAVDAPAHGQRRLRRTQPDEVHEVVAEPRPGPRAERRHGLHRPVARLAFDRRADVR